MNYSGQLQNPLFYFIYVVIHAFLSPDLLVIAAAITPTYQVFVGGLFFVCSNRYGSFHRPFPFLLVIKKKKKTVKYNLYWKAGLHPTH